ncbi:hypothetical protein IJJ97_04340 [bacterium]|nr:hypothetical protein [bacterium]
MVNNTNFTYTKINIIDPMFRTTFGTMEIPTGWHYTPNIVWNFPNKNIVIYIMAESPDKTESFTILPFAFGLTYVNADIEYFSQIQMLQQQIFNFRIVRETNQPSQKVEQSIKSQINKTINSYKAIGVTSLAHFGQYTYRSATINGKINGFDTVTTLEIASIREPTPFNMLAPFMLPNGIVPDFNPGTIRTIRVTVKNEHQHLLSELSNKIQQIQIDKNWLKLKDSFFSSARKSSQRTSNISTSNDRISQLRKERDEIYRSMRKNASESQDRVRAMYNKRMNGSSSPNVVNSSSGHSSGFGSRFSSGQDSAKSSAQRYRGDYNYMYVFERDDGTIIRTNSSLFDPNTDLFNYNHNWTEIDDGYSYQHTFESDDGTIVQTDSSLFNPNVHLYDYNQHWRRR